MKSRLIHAVVSLVVFGAFSAILVGLTRQPNVRADAAVEQEAEHEHGEHEGEVHAEAVGCDDCAQEGHAAAERPDLDERLAAPCEHAVAIIDCDECRYEAGVAKIAPATAQGLVESRAVHAEQRAAKRLHLTGEVQLDLTRVVEIAPAGSGRVDGARKILGDTVRASDVLAVIQSSEFGEAQARFLEARARRDLAAQTHEREKQLHDRKISSEADYLAARNEWTAAEAAVAAACKRLQLFGLEDEQIDAFAKADSNEPFGQLTLVAPIGGTIIEQNVVRGQLVGTSDTLYRIADLSRVWVWCDVYESDLAALHERVTSDKPVPAEVRVGAFPQAAFRGTVDMIDNQIDRETRTLKVRVVVDNPEEKLKPGMFAKVSIDLDGVQTIIRVPETAVLSDAGRQFVFTRLSDELWVRRDVTIGSVDGGFVEVRSGLTDEDIVATKGAFMFKSEILKEKMGAGCAH